MASWIPSMTGWEDHGGVFNFEPVISTWRPNRLDILVWGDDDHLYHQAWDGTKWLPSMTVWEDHGGLLMSDPVSCHRVLLKDRLLKAVTSE